MINLKIDIPFHRLFIVNGFWISMNLGQVGNIHVANDSSFI